jgi:Gas vesicle synthesis protein GvpO
MAQRRSTRSEADEEERTAKRRPPRGRTPPPADRDEREAVAEPEDSDELEDFDEPETVDDREPEDEYEADDEPDGEEPDREESRRAERGNGSALTAKQAAQAALAQIMDLTDKSAEGITEVGRIDDGWVIGIEVVEDRRIPSATDILASYHITLDAEGELMSYRRVRRYMRGRGDSGDGS